MRLSRRAAIRWAVGSAGAAVAGAILLRDKRIRGPVEITPLQIQAAPLGPFRRGEPELRRFGDLVFRSGLVLSSETQGFGGLSGLWRDPVGDRLVAVTDNAQWLTARVDYVGGRLSGLSDAILAPILGQDGSPLRNTKAYDTEALAIADGIAYVGIERVHEVRRFTWRDDGVRARGVPITVPPEMKRLPTNGSIEAVAVAPPDHPLAGSVVAIAEEARVGASAPTEGWVLTGARRFGFDVARSDDFDITDAAFLPMGDLLLLERSFSVAKGVACRMRRIARDAIEPSATLDGPVIFLADKTHEIDNIEGLGLHPDPVSGETVVTLVSDDNFSRVQRTLLLEFVLVA